MAKLYIAATPIGNLGDITLRALDTLKNADIIAAEDTRHTRKLLTHFEISKPLISYHEYSDIKKAEDIIDEIIQGKNVAFVSDAGTPAISDPGRMLVAIARKNNVEVEGVPGACAAVCAYSVAGLESKSFVFYGFLDDKQTKRISQIQELSALDFPVILYVSPHKLLKTLADIKEVSGERATLTILRELTKIHEEYLHGSADTLIRHFTENEPKGEFVMIMETEKERKEFSDDEIIAEVKLLIEKGMSTKEAAKEISEKTGIPKNKIYKMALK